MADIKKVNWDKLIEGASNIASTANEMQKNIKSAFKQLEELRNSWNGNRYDLFVTSVNQADQGLNTLFSTTVSKIPHEIAAKAKSYASLNSEKAKAFNEQTAIILEEIPKTSKGSEFRFRSAEVKSAEQSIKSKFTSAENNADKAISIANSLKGDWDSISGDENIYDLIAAFKKVKNIISSISRSLTGTITTTEQEISLKETAIAAGDAVKGVADQIGENASKAIDTANDAMRQAAADWRSLLGG